MNTRLSQWFKTIAGLITRIERLKEDVSIKDLKQSLWHGLIILSLEIKLLFVALPLYFSVTKLYKKMKPKLIPLYQKRRIITLTTLLCCTTIIGGKVFLEQISSSEPQLEDMFPLERTVAWDFNQPQEYTFDPELIEIRDGLVTLRDVNDKQDNKDIPSATSEGNLSPSHSPSPTVPILPTQAFQLPTYTPIPIEQPAETSHQPKQNETKTQALWNKVGDLLKAVMRIQTVYAEDKPVCTGSSGIIRANDSIEIKGLVRWTGFIEVADKNAGEIGYQLSDNNRGRWLYWDGEEWTRADSDDFSSAQDIHANISSFPTENNTILFRARMQSTCGHDVSLLRVGLTYIADESDIPLEETTIGHRWAITLGNDMPVCMYEPQWVTLPGITSPLSGKKDATLQTSWRITTGENEKTTCPDSTPDCGNEFFQTETIPGTTRFTRSVWWPGIDAQDTNVRVRLLGTVRDKNNQPISDTAHLDIYWHPGVCPAPAAQPPEATTSAQLDKNLEEKTPSSPSASLNPTDFNLADNTLTPFLDCVEKNTDGTLTAHFGYTNDLDEPITVPYGEKNRLHPTIQATDQIETFQPGLNQYAVEIKTDETPLVWILGNRFAIATENSDLCPLNLADIKKETMTATDSATLGNEASTDLAQTTTQEEGDTEQSDDLPETSTFLYTHPDIPDKITLQNVDTFLKYAYPTARLSAPRITTVHHDRVGDTYTIYGIGIPHGDIVVRLRPERGQPTVPYQAQVDVHGRWKVIHDQKNIELPEGPTTVTAVSIDPGSQTTSQHNDIHIFDVNKKFMFLLFHAFHVPSLVLLLIIMAVTIVNLAYNRYIKKQHALPGRIEIDNRL